MQSELVTIVLLGVAFFLVITPFQTGCMIQKVVVDTIKDENKDIKDWDGYVSLSIIYLVFAFTTWITPSTVSLIGSKWSMFLGSLCYNLYSANFLYPLNWGLYTVSVILGLGAALIWTGQGNYMTINSTKEHVTRNSGIFWAIFQCSLLFGNIFVFFMFRGQKVITKETRIIVYGVLTVVGLIGSCLLFFLKGNSREVGGQVSTPKEAFFKSVGLLKIPQVWGLCVIFAFTGLFQSLALGVYSAAIGNTHYFKDANKFMGIAGMLIGIGEIAGGAAFGIFGGKYMKKQKDTVVLIGFLIMVLAFALIYFNMPFQASLKATEAVGIIKPGPILAIALFVCVLLGLGDACFITQTTGFMSEKFFTDSASIFALFKFVQSIFSTIGYNISNVAGIDVLMYIMLPSAALGSLAFFVIEWKQRKIVAFEEAKISPGASSQAILVNEAEAAK